MSVALNCWLCFPPKFRLFIYRFLLWLGLSLYGPTTSSTCFRLPFNLYANVGLGVDMSEANALRFVSQRIAGPIPSLIDAIPVQGGGAFIVMTRLPGKPLGRRLFAMSPQQKTLLASDLKRVFKQLRSIPPPQEGPKICGVDGGPVLCYRVCVDRIGPFTTEMDFYKFLYDRLVLEEQGRLKLFAKAVHTRAYPLCLHHNDLAPQNILIDEKGRLSGLLDWAGLSWFPEYWEWTRSYYAKESYPPWLSLMDEVFGRWEEELQVEQELWKFGSIW